MSWSDTLSDCLRVSTVLSLAVSLVGYSSNSTALNANKVTPWGGESIARDLLGCRVQSSQSHRSCTYSMSAVYKRVDSNKIK